MAHVKIHLPAEWTALHLSGGGWEMLYSQHRCGIRAKVNSDWEIRSWEHIGTESTFLFYFEHQVLRDCGVDFSELCERGCLQGNGCLFHAHVSVINI